MYSPLSAKVVAKEPGGSGGDVHDQSVVGTEAILRFREFIDRQQRGGTGDEAMRDWPQELAVCSEQAGRPAGGGADEPDPDMQAKRSGTVGLSA